MNTTTIGKRIKTLREQKNLTQEYIAEKLDISQSTYGRFENDITEMSVAKLLKLAECLETSIEDILKLENSTYLHNVHGNTSSNGNTNSPHSIVNDKFLIEELIKSKDEVIENLKMMLKMQQNEIENLKIKRN